MNNSTLKTSDVENKINEIHDKQKNAEVRLRKALERLDSENDDISLETNFLGVVKEDSIKAALTKLSTNTANHFEVHYAGINSLFDHINEVLSLIQMTSVIETDLYRLLDDNSMVTADCLEWLRNKAKDIHENSLSQINGAIERVSIINQLLDNLKTEIIEISNNSRSQFQVVTREIRALSDSLSKVDSASAAHHKKTNTYIWICYGISMLGVALSLLALFIIVALWK